jgi:hypothetical protein
VKEILPWKTELIEGDFIRVDQRQLAPVVKMQSVIQRQVTFGTEGSSGRGGGMVWLQPVAVIERHPDGSEQRIPITDVTRTAIQGMLLGALTLPVLYLFFAGLAFVWRRRHANTLA